MMLSVAVTTWSEQFVNAAVVVVVALAVRVVFVSHG
jgi:hypothetical protein